MRLAALGHDIERAVESKKVRPSDFSNYDEFKAAHAANSAKILGETERGPGMDLQLIDFDKEVRKGGPHYFRIGRDVRIFIIFLGALMNQPLLTLLLIALLMNIENIRRVVVLYKNG